MSKITSLLFFVAVTAFGSNAFANGNPSSVKVNIYGVAVSQNANCSNAQMVSYNPAGTVYELTQNPQLVSGNLPTGSYQCVVLYMDDLITYIPATNVGTNCVAGQTYQRIICHSDSSCQYTTATIANGALTYGSTATSSASSSSDTSHINQVLLFLSTGSTATNGNHAFQQPVSPPSSNGLQLSGAFTVSPTGGTGTFVINFNNQITDTGSTCDLEPPTFSFR